MFVHHGLIPHSMAYGCVWTLSSQDSWEGLLLWSSETLNAFIITGIHSLFTLCKKKWSKNCHSCLCILSSCTQFIPGERNLGNQNTVKGRKTKQMALEVKAGTQWFFPMALNFRVVKLTLLYLSNQGFINCNEHFTCMISSELEAAIHTSVTGTKIPCDFTQQLAEECEELSHTGC